MTVVVGVIGICTHALESVFVVDRKNHEQMSAKRLESLLQASQCLFILTMASISCCVHRNDMASNFCRYQKPSIICVALEIIIMQIANTLVLSMFLIQLIMS